MIARLALAFAGFVLVVAGWLGCLPAAARDTCSGTDGIARSQLVLNVCSAEAARRSSRDVGRRYLAYRETLAGGRRRALDRTQRAWAAYRDAYCAEKGAAVSGGSIQPLVVNTCINVLDRRRALDLANDRDGR